MTEHNRVYVILLVGVLSFTSSPILIRLAEDEASGAAVAALRTTFAVLMLLPFAFSGEHGEWRRLSLRESGQIVLAGVLLGVHFIIWIESLYHTSVASATVIVSTSPIFLAILGFLFLKERLSRNVVLAILISVVGAGLIGFGDMGDEAFPNALWGNTLSLVACLVLAAYLLIGRVARQRLSWIGYVFPMYAVVALTTLGYAWVNGVPLLGYSPRIYILCALMALLPQICGHGSLNYAVRYMPAALVGLATLLEPVGASIIAAIWFQEIPRPLSLVGTVIVLIAVMAIFLPLLRQGGARIRETQTSRSTTP